MQKTQEMKQTEQPESFDWVQAEVDQIYKTSRDISPERWDRVRWEIDFRDLTLQLLEETGNLKAPLKGGKLSCPFHGKDSTASFALYPASNSAFCFGCPPPTTNQFYDNVRIVSAVYGISKTDSLKWLERKYKLPPLAPTLSVDDPEAKREDYETIELTFDDLMEPFLALSTVLLKERETHELLSIFFKAQQTKDPFPLAQVLGRDRVQRLLRQKTNGRNKQ